MAMPKRFPSDLDPQEGQDHENVFLNKNSFSTQHTHSNMNV